MLFSRLSIILTSIGCSILAAVIHAATFDVATPAELQPALNTAAVNGQDDTIRLATGAYAISSTLIFDSTEDFSLTLSGLQTNAVILDGGGTRQVLFLRTTLPRGVITLENLTVQNGVTAGSGGGMQISTETASIHIERCRVRQCAATAGDSIGGGALLNASTGAVTVLHSEFLGNQSSGNIGGLAIGTDSGRATVGHTVFTSNQVNNSGGSEFFGDGGGLMVYSENASHASIVSNRFVGNRAMGGSNPDGGGLMTYQSGSGSTLTLSNNEFIGNQAGLGGGGCILRFNQSADVAVISNAFMENQAMTGSGGGALVYLTAGTLVYSSNRHLDNEAWEDGGGLWVSLSEGSALIASNTFSANQADGNGGGLALTTDAGTATVSRNVLDSNHSGNSGGALNLATGTGTLNALHNTLHGNQASTDGGGLYLYLDQSTAGSDLHSHIIWSNTPNAFAYSYGSGGDPITITYSTIDGADSEPWFGSGCLTNNPRFLDPTAGNFLPGWTAYPVTNETRSPCIDTGNPASPPDADGTRADMGALAFPQGLATMGTPHWWLDCHALTAGGLSFDAAEQTDTDGDAAEAWEEFIADTDPTNALSVFRILRIQAAPTIRVSFLSSTNRHYTLHGCAALDEDIWTPVPGAGPRPGSGDGDILSDTNTPPLGPFYQVRARLP